MPLTTEDTSFTHDILGRYACNTFAEAKNSGTSDIVIVGGGTFGLTLAEDVRAQPTTRRRVVNVSSGATIAAINRESRAAELTRRPFAGRASARRNHPRFSVGER